MTAPDLAGVRSICFVCLGNICRSPMGDVIVQHLEASTDRPLGLDVSSAGLGDWHIGDQADPRARAALSRNGYDGERHRARQFTPEWFARVDLVLGFDESHIDRLRGLASTDTDRDKVQLLLPFAWADDPENAPVDPEVHDPYFGGDDGFDETIKLVDAAVRHLYARLGAAQARRSSH